MRRLIAVPLTFLCASVLARGQSSSRPQETNADRPVQVTKMGPGTTAPVLLPADFSEPISDNCERKYHGKTEIALIVDVDGRARNMQFVKPAINDLDRLAIEVAETDRFTPATQAGVAVAIGESLELQIEGCLLSTVDSSGKKTYMLKLAAPAVQKLRSYDGYPAQVIYARVQLPINPTSLPPDQLRNLGRSLVWPLPLSSPDAEYSEEGRRKHIHGTCVVSLFVDAYGLPHNMQVTDSLEPSMDQKALEAVNRFRFKPALRDGLEPVTVRITVHVKFHP